MTASTIGAAMLSARSAPLRSKSAGVDDDLPHQSYIHALLVRVALHICVFPKQLNFVFHL